MFSGSWFVKQNYVYDTQPHIQPTLDPQPEQTETENDRVVRRVVYEEAKVPKK